MKHPGVTVQSWFMEIWSEHRPLIIQCESNIGNRMSTKFSFMIQAFRFPIMYPFQVLTTIEPTESDMYNIRKKHHHEIKRSHL